jgi:hypothetical protein
VSARYRCSACGNLTRFDVVQSRRTRAFHHFSVGGELSIEDEEVLEAHVEEITCRWCGASGDRIEEVPLDDTPDRSLHDGPGGGGGEAPVTRATGA